MHNVAQLPETSRGCGEHTRVKWRTFGRPSKDGLVV
jgi:hypothetical protein